MSSADLIDRYTAGEDLMLNITITRMKVNMFTFKVAHIASGVVNIMDKFN